MKRTVATLAFLFYLITPVHADTMYVNDIVKITLRTGPGIDHKVIRMIKSGQEVEIVEQGEDWSRVRLPDNEEGWVLSRFVTPEKPSGLILKQLEYKHQKLLEKAETLETENKTLKTENQELTRALETHKAQLEDTTQRYTSLKNDSEDFLKLKSDYENSTAQLKEQREKVRILTEQLLQRNIELFLLGAGVLLIGFLIGLIMKKKKRRSSLLS